MASSGKRKTTMAKLNRERALLEKRQEKKARKAARKQAALDGPVTSEYADPHVTNQYADAPVTND
jgi:hypothetical protein